MKTRVCIADAVTVFRAGVREVLLREKDFDVVEAVDLTGLGQALEGDDGLHLALRELARGRARSWPQETPPRAV